MTKVHKYIVSCPLCGKILFKSLSASKLEIQCQKCHGNLNIEVIDGCVAVTEMITGNPNFSGS